MTSEGTGSPVAGRTLKWGWTCDPQLRAFPAPPTATAWET